MENKLFNKSYVLRVTAKHMRKAVDISIRKTFDRIKDFDNDPAKSKEVIETLSLLHLLRKNLDDFQLEYKEDFRGDIKDE